MKRHLLFPAMAFVGVLLSAALHDGAQAADQDCGNNKVCDTSRTCFEQTGGPDTMCVTWGPFCWWEVCGVE